MLSLLSVTAISCDRAESDTRDDDRAEEYAEYADVQSDTVVLLVASSLAPVIEDLVGAFEEEFDDYTIDVVVGPTNGLARQLLRGAPAHVFVGAHQEWVEWLTERGHVGDSKALLSNQLALVVPSDSQLAIEDPKGLLSESVQHIAIADNNVPVGMYSEESLKSLDLFDQLSSEGKFVRGWDARSLASYLRRGEVDAVITYQTEALHDSDAKIVYLFPHSLTGPLQYSVMLLAKQQTQPGAKEFYDFLSSETAGAIFAKQGFTPVGAQQQDLDAA